MITIEGKGKDEIKQTRRNFGGGFKRPQPFEKCRRNVRRNATDNFCNRTNVQAQLGIS